MVLPTRTLSYGSLLREPMRNFGNTGQYLVTDPMRLDLVQTKFINELVGEVSLKRVVQPVDLK